MFAPCPRANEITDQLKASAEYRYTAYPLVFSYPFLSRKLFSDNKEFLEFLTEQTGMRVNMEDAYLINDALYIEVEDHPINNQYHSNSENLQHDSSRMVHS